jgi:hypothetical protein
MGAHASAIQTYIRSKDETARISCRCVCSGCPFGNESETGNILASRQRQKALKQLSWHLKSGHLSFYEYYAHYACARSGRDIQLMIASLGAPIRALPRHRTSHIPQQAGIGQPRRLGWIVIPSSDHTTTSTSRAMVPKNLRVRIVMADL